jgi:hypothetical protein
MSSNTKRSGLAAAAVSALAAGMLITPSAAFADVAPARDLAAACDDAPAPDTEFSDIGGLAEATQTAINCMVAYGITEGYSDGTFRPNEEIQRYQMALFLYRELQYAADNSDGAIELPAPADAGFEDIDELEPEAQDAINALAAVDITTGTSDSTFSPGAPVTRRDMAVFINRVQDYIAEQTGDDTAAWASTDDNFEDVPATLNGAEAVNNLAENGIAQGTVEGDFEPFRNVLRSEMALFIMRQVDDNVAEGRIDAVEPPITSNQDFAVTPTESQVLPYGAPSAETTRTYQVAVPAGTVVDIVLFNGANVSVDENDQVTFADATGTANVADQGNIGGATITQVNGVPGASADQITSSGNITFSVTSTSDVTVVPVVFADAADDDALNLVVPGTANNNPKAPTDDFGIGGAAIFTEPEAGVGASTPTVDVVDTTNDFFTDGSVSYFYDGNDTFQFGGQPLTLEEFESVLSTTDELSVSYAPNPAGVSTFNVTLDEGADAPTTVSAQVVNADAGATVNDVRVTYTRPADNSSGVTYSLQRQVGAGAFTTVAGATQSAGTGAGVFVFTDLNVPNGTYNYRVVATAPVTGATDASTPVGPVVVPGVVETDAPVAIDTVQSTNAGLAGTLGTGDVVTVVFNETVTAGAGATVRVRDTDAAATLADITNGTNATFAVNAAPQTVNGVSRAAGSVITITLTADPTVVSAGTVTGVQLPADITDQSGIRDAVGNGWAPNPAASTTSDVRIETVGSDTQADASNQSPAALDQTASDAATTLTEAVFVFDEAVRPGSVTAADFAIAQNGAAGVGTLGAPSVSSDGLTITVPVTGGVTDNQVTLAADSVVDTAGNSAPASAATVELP